MSTSLETKKETMTISWIKSVQLTEHHSITIASTVSIQFATTDPEKAAGVGRK